MKALLRFMKKKGKDIGKIGEKAVDAAKTEGKKVFDKTAKAIKEGPSVKAGAVAGGAAGGGLGYHLATKDDEKPKKKKRAYLD